MIIKVSDIKSINIDIEDHRVEMITIPSEHDPLMSQGIHHKAIDTNEIFKLIDRLINDPDKKNIGHHKAYIKLSDGSIRSFEDIGRHNTIDKAIGHMILYEYDPAESNYNSYRYCQSLRNTPDHPGKARFIYISVIVRTLIPKLCLLNSPKL